MQYLKIVIEGRVQGVYFRVFTQKKARQLAIRGTVRNQANGNVEIQAAGEEQDMQAFLQWCHKGPWLAKVTAVTQTLTQEEPKYTNFTIID